MIKNISKINLMVSLKRSKGNYGPGDPPVPFQLKIDFPELAAISEKFN